MDGPAFTEDFAVVISIIYLEEMAVSKKLIKLTRHSVVSSYRYIAGDWPFRFTLNVTLT